MIIHRKARRGGAWLVGVTMVAAATALTGLVALGAVGSAPAAAAKESNAGPCPTSNSLDGFKAYSNVDAHASTNGTTTTYTFTSFVTENPVNGVPGLVKFCVYPDPSSRPSTVTPTVRGANDAPWTSAKGTNNFAFMRPGGNKTNIPLDGTSRAMGSATWDSVPASQTILLHIADPNVCASLYGGTPSTCFVKPAAGPICNAGDSALAYNAMPYGVVNCPKPSLGFEATSTNEFGDGVTLAGTARTLDSLQVLFTSYACQTSGHWNTGDCVTSTPGATFTHTITAHIYAPGDLTTPLATATQVFTDIPYRPSADASCPDPSQWFNPVTGACQYSISKVLTFTDWTPSTGVTLPDQVVWTVAFNTSTAGYLPIGPATCSGTSAGCPYDSLNVGTQTFANAPYAGTDTQPDVAYRSTPSPSGTLQPEPGWTGLTPLGGITTS